DSDGPCLATGERVRARRTRPASLPDCASAAESPGAGTQPRGTMPHLTGVSTLARRRLSERHPSLYPLAVRVHQLRRHVAWLTADTRWAIRAPGTPELPIRVKKHGSLLPREL